MFTSSAESSTSTSGLTSLTYRSRAVEPLSVDELRRLERESQRRNHNEGLTGFAIYEEGNFSQWLEGPAESVSRVWDSVSRDPRHTDITDLTIRSTSVRLFDGWDMALAIRGSSSLTTSSTAAPLLSLVPPPSLRALHAITESELAVQWGKEPAAGPLIPLIPVLVEALVVPQMISKHGMGRRLLPRVSPVAARLSRLLLAEDARPATKVLRGLYARAGSLAPLCATVLEPAARGIGDLWLADDCSQLDMTMALSRLQTIIRHLNVGAAQVALDLPVVLVAPQPGEVHVLGAGLDAELFWQAGWDTHREFPATDEALHAMLSETWIDVLDLALSPALQHASLLPLMKETIAGARTASLNPALTVLVGGRAFVEQCEGSASVGADASTTSSLQVVLAATSARQVTLAALAERTCLATS